MADDHHSTGIAVERLHKRLTRVDVKVIGGLVKYQQMWRIAGDKSQSQPRAFTARQGAHLLNRAVAGKAETTQLCPHRARRRALHLANHRSEEHTSEHQSTISTSYDVFCLKK